MAKNLSYFSLASHGLKYKLRISVYLMSVLPLLVCIYLVSNYILPKFGLRIDIAAAIFISIFIAVIGFFVIKEVFDRLESVTSEAKLIAAGDITRTLEVAGEEDEVGVLGEALNQLTQRIRSNVDELKNYNEKTTEINLEIQKRVLVLSSLLQISSLISQGAKLDDISELITEKARFLANSDIAYLLFREEGENNFSMKVAEGINSEYLLKINVGLKDNLFNKVINQNKMLILDKQNILPDNLRAEFYEKFRLKNTLALPVFLKGKVRAILGIGSTKEPFLYKKEDEELLDIFAKQIAIAVENDILMHRVEKLEIKDALTGLYNEAFIASRLQEEIKRAVNYRRPCAFILFDIDNFQKFLQAFGSLQAEAMLKNLSVLIRDSVTEVDRVGRTGGDQFSIVLPERNKRQALEIAENIRKKIAFSYSEEADPNRKITISAGVSENPLDGITAQELIDKAKDLLAVAKAQGKNRTQV